MESSEAISKLQEALTDRGLKFTQQRRLITEMFFDAAASEQHPTVEELYLRVRQRDERVGYATVYRTLKLLVECGLATGRRLGGRHVRYEPEIPGEHHDHLVCDVCGQVFEFEEEGIEALQDEVAARLGFELSSHRMVLHGRPIEGGAHVCKVNS